MTTGRWLLVDHLVALLSVVAWFAAGVTMALGRLRPARALLVAAVLATLARVATVATLAGQGWWFAQEKVLLGLPILAVAALVGVLTRSVAALLTTAYAALAGLVVTFLVGYPLTWGTALITIAAVCLGSLLTARAVAPAPEVVDDAVRPGLTRRRLITAAGGVLVVAAGGTGVGLSNRLAETVVTGGGPGPRLRSSRSVADLRGASTPAPGGVARRHTLTARSATVRLPTGREVDAWTFDDRLPGPAITATEGDLVEVTLRNEDIDDGVTLHWHGYDIPCGEDGAPGATQHAVGPGEEFGYRFRADHVGTYWYHTHQASHVGVRRGLYGALVVHPRGQQEQGLDLTLPVHTFDGTLVIGDRDGRTDHVVGAGTPVRLRVINTDSDPHALTLAGTAFRVAAVDGRDLNQPDEVSDVSLRLPAGGRYDLAFDMPEGPVSLVVDDDRDAGLSLQSEGIDGESEAEDASGWSELDLLTYGAPAAPDFDPDRADRHFTLVLDRGVAMVDGRPAYAQTVNGLAHPSIPDQLVAEGDVVRFTVVNRSLETHPWHLHGHPVLVLSRDGTPSSGSPLWLDTFDVRPGEVWEVAFAATNPGIWMNHCHNLPHADQGMMLRLVYDGVTTPYGGSGHEH